VHEVVQTSLAAFAVGRNCSLRYNRRIDVDWLDRSSRCRSTGDDAWQATAAPAPAPTAWQAATPTGASRARSGGASLGRGRAFARAPRPEASYGAFPATPAAAPAPAVGLGEDHADLAEAHSVIGRERMMHLATNAMVRPLHSTDYVNETKDASSFRGAGSNWNDAVNGGGGAPKSVEHVFTHYMDAVEQGAHTVAASTDMHGENRLTGLAGGAALDTTGASGVGTQWVKDEGDQWVRQGAGRHIYTMDPQNRIISSDPWADHIEKPMPGASHDASGNERTQLGFINHSSHERGLPVAAAGDWRVAEGKVTNISNNTGHYRTGPENLQQATSQLSAMGVTQRFGDAATQVEMVMPESKIASVPLGAFEQGAPDAQTAEQRGNHQQPDGAGGKRAVNLIGQKGLMMDELRRPPSALKRAEPEARPFGDWWQQPDLERLSPMDFYGV
jgi:hypothetical protein